MIVDLMRNDLSRGLRAGQRDRAWAAARPGRIREYGIWSPMCAARSGICLGHQAIAAAYGAAIMTAPQPVHGRASPITHDGRGLLTGLPQPFPAARYHSLIVHEGTLLPDLLITARGPGGIPMGLRHARHAVEGLQFHPESVLTAQGGTIIQNFIQAVRAARRSSPCRHPAGRA